MDGWINVLIDRWRNRLINRWVNELMDRQKDGQIDWFIGRNIYIQTFSKD